MSLMDVEVYCSSCCLLRFVIGCKNKALRLVGGFYDGTNGRLRTGFRFVLADSLLELLLIVV